MAVLGWAEAWHCTPSQVLEEPYDPALIQFANRWGVRPSQVLDEDVRWLHYQNYVDEMVVKLGRTTRQNRN
jgi:hypothetical protein